jgi:hypothetical protein
MACREWKDEWVAKLYDELDPLDEPVVSEHLAQCPACRATLDELAAVRSTLSTCAANEPATIAPRVLVLRSRRMHPAWGLGAGLAASLLVFASGLYVGGRLPEPGRTVLPVGAVLTRDDLAAIETRIRSLEHRASTSDATLQTAQRELPPNTVTDLELRAEMDRLARRMRGERALDMEFLLDELSATEWRTGKWIDETREAVRYVALRDDERLTER